MNAKQKRERVLSAVRGQMRHLGLIPEHQSFYNVLCILDDFIRIGHESGLWYEDASNNQIKLLKRDWNRWRDNTCGMIKME